MGGPVASACGSLSQGKPHSSPERNTRSVVQSAGVRLERRCAIRACFALRALVRKASLGGEGSFETENARGRQANVGLKEMRGQKRRQLFDKRMNVTRWRAHANMARVISGSQQSSATGIKREERYGIAAHEERQIV